MIFNSSACFTTFWLRNLNFCRWKGTQINVGTTSTLDISIKLPFSVHLSHNDTGTNGVVYNVTRGESQIEFTKKANCVSLFSNAAVSSKEICANVKVPFHSSESFK